MTSEEIAWFAGIFDGEGCIQFNGKTQVTMVVKMNDRDIIDRLQFVSGVGNVRSEAPKRKINVWQAGKRDDVEQLLKKILPWMGERRSKKIHEALLRLKNNPGWGDTPLEHGTVAGYHKERHRGITFCMDCLEAQRKHRREYYQQRKNKNDQ